MKNNEEPIVALPNKTREEISYNYKLLSDKDTLKEFLVQNGIKGWPRTNWDVNQGHSSYLKFWDGNFIG